MPARKSQGEDGLSVDDLSLPRSMVQRLAKGVLPANSQIQKDAVAALSKSATVFVNYIAAEANERAQSDNKKTIQPQHVFEALKELEFEAFLPRCQDELSRYNTIQCDKRNSYRAKIRQEKQDRTKGEGETSVMSERPLDSAAASGHPSKKARRSSGAAADPDDEDMDMDDEANDDDEEGQDEAIDDDDAGADADAGEEEEAAEQDDDDDDRHKPRFEEEDDDGGDSGDED